MKPHSEERIAIIIGASSGIGEAAARMLAENGIRVILSARREERLHELVSSLNEAGAQALGVPGDIRDAAVLDKILVSAENQWNRPPDIFILSAGLGLPGSLLNSDNSRWQEMLEVNYVAVLNQLRACGEFFVRLAKEEQGAIVRDIVVIGSTIGRVVSPFNPVYGSTKFAVHSIVEALRQEVCAHQIRTTLIEPGFVKSGFQSAAGYNMEWFDSIEAEFGPLLTGQDVARTINFVIQQPGHVHVDDIRIRPTRQKV